MPKRCSRRRAKGDRHCQGVSVMSTPSGKPFDPFDLSPYAPKRAREHADRPPVENGDNHESEDAAAIALAYVPRAAMRPAAEEHPVDRMAARRRRLAAEGPAAKRSPGRLRDDRRRSRSGAARIEPAVAATRGCGRPASARRSAAARAGAASGRPAGVASARRAVHQRRSGAALARVRAVCGRRRRRARAATICAGRCASCWRA